MRDDHHGFVDEFSHDELSAMGYDRRDIKLKPIAWGVVWHFIFMIGSVPICFGFYWLLVKVVGEDQPPITVRKMPPAPVVQTNITAAGDIHALRQQENEKLNTKGWVDAEKGKVHIPVDEAIDIVARDGLPQASAEKAAASEAHREPEKEPTR
ncbi:MAG: hypothetical protein HONBIEJF_01268 [Fimbriimonadaceae bacterium]|nr:hypothetical protein [Fimbriimonadaceae bacterium]